MLTLRRLPDADRIRAAFRARRPGGRGRRRLDRAGDDRGRPRARRRGHRGGGRPAAAAPGPRRRDGAGLRRPAPGARGRPAAGLRGAGGPGPGRSSSPTATSRAGRHRAGRGRHPAGHPAGRGGRPGRGRRRPGRRVAAHLRPGRLRRRRRRQRRTARCSAADPGRALGQRAQRRPGRGQVDARPGGQLRPGAVLLLRPVRPRHGVLRLGPARLVRLRGRSAATSPAGSSSPSGCPAAGCWPA